MGAPAKPRSLESFELRESREQGRRRTGWPEPERGLRLTHIWPRVRFAAASCPPCPAAIGPLFEARNQVRAACGRIIASGLSAIGCAAAFFSCGRFSSWPITRKFSRSFGKTIFSKQSHHEFVTLKQSAALPGKVRRPTAQNAGAFLPIRLRSCTLAVR
jgi:hypothetical protein